jgi:hypothetical protein
MEPAGDHSHQAERAFGGDGQKGEDARSGDEQAPTVDVQRQVGKGHGSQQLGQLQYPKGHDPATELLL